MSDVTDQYMKLADKFKTAGGDYPFTQTLYFINLLLLFYMHIEALLTASGKVVAEHSDLTVEIVAALEKASHVYEALEPFMRTEQRDDSVYVQVEAQVLTAQVTRTTLGRLWRKNIVEAP